MDWETPSQNMIINGVWSIYISDKKWEIMVYSMYNLHVEHNIAVKSCMSLISKNTKTSEMIQNFLLYMKALNFAQWIYR